MNKNEFKENSPYFKFFQTLFESLKINQKNKNIYQNNYLNSDYSKKSKEFNEYINDFLKNSFHKKN